MRGFQTWFQNSNRINITPSLARKLSKTGKISNFLFCYASENHISPDPVNYLTEVEMWDTLMHMLWRVSTKTQWRPTSRPDVFVQKYFTTSNFDKEIACCPKRLFWPSLDLYSLTCWLWPISTTLHWKSSSRAYGVFCPRTLTKIASDITATIRRTIMFR